jgi:TatD DNase family protein
MFVDSHCHIDFPELASQLPSVLGAMAREQVTHALCIGVNLPDLPGVLRIAAEQANLYASVGVHPDYEDTPEPSVDGLCKLAREPKVVAIGETGLDYYRLSGDRHGSGSDCTIFMWRVRGKPLVIHTRSAAVDTLAIMREERAGRPAA